MSKTNDFEAGGPNPVDRHVGLRIRMRRKELGWSQERLAEAIGLTFQQVQKYERASNRVSASKLWDMAQALNTTISYFFEGLGEGSEAAQQAFTHDFLLTPEGLELAGAFPKIRDERTKKKLIELVRVMANSGERG
jgi:transcriptional regulator with XRE-family HTH domain